MRIRGLRWLWSIIWILGAVSAGCTPEGRGFKLPDGDIERGKATFAALSCNDCHHISGVARSVESETGLDIQLGGPTHQIKTYGELVTSVINPSHVLTPQYPTQPIETDGQSAMRSYNDVMTVQQLVDLVTFLQDEYELRAPPSYL